MQINVGLLGYGHVGAGVAKIILNEESYLTHKLGWPIKIVKALVRNPDSTRAFIPPTDLLTTDPSEIVGNPDIQVVVELMGGLEPARSMIIKALESGQHVVTANKALLATHGLELFEIAAKSDRDIMFEASVAGAIPIIRTLKEGLTANRIQTLFGILNGTTNYILSRMTRDGLSFNDALREAQTAGYAEADPTFDVEGIDAAHKLILLTALAYGVMPRLEDIHVEGISRLEQEDFIFASELGYVIKLLAVSSQNETDGRLEVRVHPAMLPQTHLLSDVTGAMNAVLVRGHASGDIFLSGAGAGMLPTASAVMGDIIELARSYNSNCPLRTPSLGWETLRDEGLKPMSDLRTNYYLRFTVADRPGVLASISNVFGQNGISIAQLLQKGTSPQSGAVPLVMLTHNALERDLRTALTQIGTLDVLMAPARLIRVENRL